MSKKRYVIMALFLVICVISFLVIQKSSNRKIQKQEENARDENSSTNELELKNVEQKEESNKQSDKEESRKIRQQINAPLTESFEVYSEDKKIEVQVAADIQVPNVEKIPVVVVKKRSFPENQLDTITNIFLDEGSYKDDLKFEYNAITQERKQYAVSGKYQGHDAKLIIGSMREDANLEFMVKTKDSYKLTSPNEKTENECQYSEEDAIKLCTQVMKNLKIEEEFQLVHTDWLYNTKLYQNSTDGRQMCGYRFSFTRLFNSVGINYDETLNQYTKQSLQSNFELVTCDVTNDGVVQFQWNLPMHSIEKLAEDTKILSYQQIVEVFKKQIIVQNGSSNNQNRTRFFRVKRIVLGLMPIKNTEDDTEETYTLLPVWDFYENDSSTSLLTLNAIDGSVIKRMREY